MNAGKARKLQVWESKRLQTIYKGVNKDGVWRRRTNDEIEELYSHLNITAFRKAQRIRWLRQVMGLSDARAVKRLLMRAVSGKRPRGRPRKRKLDSVSDDIVRDKLESKNCGQERVENHCKSSLGPVFIS